MGTGVSWDDVEAAAACGQSLAAFLPREFLVPDQSDQNQRPCERSNDTARVLPERSGYACNAEPHPATNSVKGASCPTTNWDNRHERDLSPLEVISIVRAELAQGTGLRGPALQAAKHLSTLDWVNVFAGRQAVGSLQSTPGVMTAAVVHDLLANVHTGAVAAAVMITEGPRLCQGPSHPGAAQKSSWLRDGAGSSPLGSPPADLVALVHDCCTLVGVRSLTDAQLSQLLQGLGYASCVPWGKDIEQEIWLHHFASHQS